MYKLRLYYQYHKDVYTKDLLSISSLIGLILILVLYTRNILIVLIMSAITFIRAIFIYRNRIKDISELEKDMTNAHNVIIESIEEIDDFLKSLDVDSITDIAYENFRYMSDKLTYFYENVYNISDMAQLNNIYVDLEKMKEDINSILNGNFIEPKTWSNNTTTNNYTHPNKNADNISDTSVAKEDIILIGKYLNILELPNNLRDTNLIKLAYRRLSKKYHPDIDKSLESEKKFKEIKDAYSHLKVLLEIK